MEIKYDSTLEDLKKVIEIKFNGEDINLDAKYSVSVSGYLATGGDGYEVFTEGLIINDDMPFQDALYEEFKKAGLIEMPKLGRLIDISEYD